MNIGFKSSGDILDTSYIKLCADDFFQLVDYVRILTVQIYKSLEIAAAAAAASENAETFFQNHSCIDRSKVLGYTHDGNGTFRVNIVNDLIDRFG